MYEIKDRTFSKGKKNCMMSFFEKFDRWRADDGARIWWRTDVKVGKTRQVLAKEWSKEGNLGTWILPFMQGKLYIYFMRSIWEIGNEDINYGIIFKLRSHAIYEVRIYITVEKACMFPVPIASVFQKDQWSYSLKTH